MSAYLVCCLAPVNSEAQGRKAKLLGIDIFSEKTPSILGDRKTACLLEWPGETFAEAKAGLLKHLQATAPWLLPERNGGRT